MLGCMHVYSSIVLKLLGSYYNAVHRQRQDSHYVLIKIYHTNIFNNSKQLNIFLKYLKKSVFTQINYSGIIHVQLLKIAFELKSKFKFIVTLLQLHA
jgi:hypothetical protein